jgi:hypothetical protein
MLFCMFDDKVHPSMLYNNLSSDVQLLLQNFSKERLLILLQLYSSYADT